MRNKNQVKTSDLGPGEIVSNNSDAVRKKRDHGDMVARLASFDLVSIVGYVKELGQSPKEGVDGLELEISKAQILAFSCWRGYSRLPEFSILNGNLRCDVDAVVLKEIECSSELSDDPPPGFKCYRVMHDLMRSLINSQVLNGRVDEHVASRAACFYSTRLFEYLKGLGGSPCGEVDKSELAVAKAQLLAFGKWRGYSQLPELTLLEGYLTSDTYLGISGYEDCTGLIASAPVGFGCNESSHAVKRNMDGQRELKNRLHKAVGRYLVSPSAGLEPTKLFSYVIVSGVSPHGGLGGSRLKDEEPKAQSFQYSGWKGFSHQPEFATLGGHISGEENLSNKLIEDAIPRNCDRAKQNVRTDLRSFQGQMDAWEKSNDRLDGEVGCEAACFDTITSDPSGDNPDLELMRQEYCCSDLVDDPPPGFEHYRMISHCQLDLNEELNQINEEEVACATFCFDSMKIDLNEELNQVNEEEAIFSAPCFDSRKLLGYLRTLSKSPLEELCEPELIEAKSQLQAFFSWKGCSQLPEFTVYCLSLNNDSEMGFSENEACHSQSIEGPNSCFGDKDGINDVRSGSQNQSTNLRNMKPISDGTVSPQKRKRSFSFSLDENPSQKLKEEIDCNRPCLRFSENEACHSRLIGAPNPCFGDKNGIADVRSGSKNQSTNLRNMKPTSDGTVSPQKRKRSFSFFLDENLSQKLNEDIGCNMPCCHHVEIPSVSRTLSESQLGELELTEANKVASKLDEVALEPLDECHFESSGKKRTAELSYDDHISSKSRRMMIQQFKDSVSSGSSILIEPIESPEHVSVSKTPSAGNIEPAGPSYSKDSCSSDCVVEIVPEQQLITNKHDAQNMLLEVIREEMCPTSEWKISTANVASEPDNLPGKSGKELGGTTNNVGEDFGEADYHTALVLTFISSAAVPSEGYLNNVFGCFGRLIEPETKIFNKRNGCRVVYKKRADAEAAFNGVGKHGIFRDTLLSYRLKYIHSKPARASTRSRRRNNDSASYTLGGVQLPIALVGL